MRRACAVVSCVMMSCALLVFVFGPFATDANAQLVDPIFGTWTLNPAKSTYDPGPPPKAGTVRFQPRGKALRGIADITDAEGRTSHTEYTAYWDGRDYPITGAPDVDTVQLKRIDGQTSERIDKKNGKVVQTFVRRVSSDGRTMTVTQKGRDANGRPIHNVIIFDKKSTT